jgi:hypothetical protein
MASRFTDFRKSFSTLDRVAILLIVVLSLVIGLILLKGDRTAPRIKEFSWQDRQVGAEDTAFILNFTRPMDHASVEDNLRLDPPLSGKISWAGRRMAYTLNAPAPYGTEFQLLLQGARDRFSLPDDQRTQMQPFTAKFRTRDSAFVYLGVEGKEEGRLILQNLTRQEKKILTPENLVVINFEPYPEGDRILFSAAERKDNLEVLDQQLYTVTTGIEVRAPASGPKEETRRSTSSTTDEPQPAGIIQRVLDSQTYQNLKFDLSPDGQTIVVQRVNRQNSSDFGLWIVRAGAEPQLIKTEPGGDFLIAPDSSSLAMARGQGMAILPLATEEAEALDFLPKFGMVLSFARDGTAAAMVKFNSDPKNPTRSLFLVTNQGVEKELLRTDGSIIHAQFDAMRQNLYCLVTKRLPAKNYTEEPYLVAINLKTNQRTDLLQLPVQRDIQMSLAPDSLGILLDQVVSTNPTSDKAKDTEEGVVRNSEGKAIKDSRLWFFPLKFDDTGNVLPAAPEDLMLSGIRPHWLP